MAESVELGDEAFGESFGVGATGLATDDDGSVTIHIQRDPPERGQAIELAADALMAGSAP